MAAGASVRARRAPAACTSGARKVVTTDDRTHGPRASRLSTTLTCGRVPPLLLRAARTTVVPAADRLHRVIVACAPSTTIPLLLRRSGS